MNLLPCHPAEASTLCAELDDWKRRLDIRGPLPRAWAGRLRRELEAEAVAASTAMEGVAVTVEEVRRILAGTPPADVAPEDRILVEGYRQAMSFALRRADDPALGWSRELIVGLHDRILGGRYDRGAGRLRTERPAFVVNRSTGEFVFLPPDGGHIAELVDEACASIAEWTVHPAVGAAWIHVAVAAIHPFRDGNGRVARVLASLAMFRGGFKRPEFTSLEEWWGRHVADYYAAFACLGTEFDRGTDVTAFVIAHIEAQLHQARALDARERVQRRIWLAAEAIAGDHGLDARVTNALWDAFFGRPVTAGYYRSLADVSPATATNDLAAATSAGLLVAEGRRRGRRYLPGERLFAHIGDELGIEVAGPSDVLRDVIVSELGRRITALD